MLIRWWLYCWPIILVTSAFDSTHYAAVVPIVYVLTLPPILVVYWTWKQIRFLFLPTPMQILKGFKKLWPAVRKGPIVTRVHLPNKSPSSPTP